ELCDRVRRRRNAHATCATTVIIFATVQQINVVVLTHAIKFHVGVSADWRVDVTVDLARCSRRQSGELLNDAAVHGELPQPPVGDDVADLAGIRLHADGIGFDGYRLLRRTQ